MPCRMPSASDLSSQRAYSRAPARLAVAFEMLKQVRFRKDSMSAILRTAVHRAPRAARPPVRETSAYKYGLATENGTAVHNTYSTPRPDPYSAIIQYGYCIKHLVQGLSHMRAGVRGAYSCIVTAV